ncbi:hypothetical protein SAMN05216567_13610 [Variovorax sp. OK605]|nr:hypothetical protein SAMN05216567_13610 [Variovorax sp. OK605]
MLNVLFFCPIFRYEPRASNTVEDFARSVLPARPRHPQDKAKVESAVQVVERWILMRLLHRGQRVAAHQRSAHKGGFMTVVAYLPAAHRTHLEWTPERLVHGGQSIGAATGRLVARLIEERRHPEHGYRACLGLLSLARRYGRERLEASSQIALEPGTAKCVHVKAILVNERDKAAASTAPNWTSPPHEHVHGPAYYE